MGSGSFLNFVARNFDVLAGSLTVINLIPSIRCGLCNCRYPTFKPLGQTHCRRPLVTLVYPLYASVKAIETKSSVDDQQWLTYWVLYSLITLFELTFAKAIEWFPFWPYAKLAFNCWLVLPYFNGAAYVYQHYVRPLFVNEQTINIWYIPRKKNIFSRADDVLLAAEKFIDKNGPAAFKKLINKTEKVTKPKKSNKHETFDDKVVGKESKSWASNRHVTFDEVEPPRESRSWENSSFMIFDGDDNRYWT